MTTLPLPQILNQRPVAKNMRFTLASIWVFSLTLGFLFGLLKELANRTVFAKMGTFWEVKPLCWAPFEAHRLEQLAKRAVMRGPPARGQDHEGLSKDNVYARIICPDLGPAEPRLTDPPMSKRTWLLERLVLGASEASPLGASGIPPIHQLLYMSKHLQLKLAKLSGSQRECAAAVASIRAGRSRPLLHHPLKTIA